MIFKCGLTLEEEQQEHIEDVERFKQWALNGQVVFAWFPVTIKQGRCVWLEKVKKFPRVRFLRVSDNRVDMSNAEFRDWEWALRDFTTRVTMGSRYLYIEL